MRISKENDLWTQIFKIWPEAMEYQSIPVFRSEITTRDSQAHGPNNTD